MSLPRSRTTPRQFTFGVFAFDDLSGELSKQGLRLRLQGQPLQILTILIRRPGQIVTRDEFQRELWSDSTFVDFEHGLNAAMNRLRQVLGDSADHPRYIETLAGRGYRFIAPVQDTGANSVLVMATPAAEEEPAPEVVPPPGLPGKKQFPRWVAAVGVVAGLIGGYLAATRAPANTGTQPLKLSISPPTGYALEAGSSRQTFALSPDGAHLAFTAMDASGVFRMFIRDLDAIDSRPLANSIGSYHVFWAPDSRSLFLTVGDSLRRTTLVGESYQVLCDTPALMLTGVLLAPNLLISGRTMNFVVPASGGTPKAVKEFYTWPQISSRWPAPSLHGVRCAIRASPRAGGQIG